MNVKQVLNCFYFINEFNVYFLGIIRLLDDRQQQKHKRWGGYWCWWGGTPIKTLVMRLKPIVDEEKLLDETSEENGKITA
jgi:hypothetical protein